MIHANFMEMDVFWALLSFENKKKKIVSKSPENALTQRKKVENVRKPTK